MARYARRSFALIAVEHAYVDEKRRQIREVLENHGYARAMCWDSDDGYVKRDLVLEGGELEDFIFDARQCDKRRITYECKGLEKTKLCEANGLGNGRYCGDVWAHVEALQESGFCTGSENYHSFVLMEPYTVSIDTAIGFPSFVEVPEGAGGDGYRGFAEKWCGSNRSGMIVEGKIGVELGRCVNILSYALIEHMKVYFNEVKEEAIMRVSSPGVVM